MRTFVVFNGTYSFEISLWTNDFGTTYGVEIQRLPRDEDMDEATGLPKDGWFSWGHESLDMVFYTEQSAFMYACNIIWDQTIRPD